MNIEELIKRMCRYSEPVIAYKLDSDFAAAVVETIDCLQAYEDTGMGPDEIIELKARMEGLET